MGKKSADRVSAIGAAFFSSSVNQFDSVNWMYGEVPPAARLSIRFIEQA